MSSFDAIIPPMPPLLTPHNSSLVPKLSRKIFGLNRNIFILGLTSFFNDFSNEMILSAFPAFFTSVLKAGAASLGLVEGIADGASNILKIYSGQLSDKLKRRRIFIFLGYGMSVVIRPFYMIMGSVAGVLGLRVIDRIGKGVREAPRDVIISVSSQTGEMGRSFGYHRAMDTAGGILGPLAAYLILSKWPGGFNIIFMSAFVIGLIAVATIFFVKDVVIARDGIRLCHSRSVLSRANSVFHATHARFCIRGHGSVLRLHRLYSTRLRGQNHTRIRTRHGVWDVQCSCWFWDNDFRNRWRLFVASFWSVERIICGRGCGDNRVGGFLCEYEGGEGY